LPTIFGDLSSAGLYIGSSDNVLTAEESGPAVRYQSYCLPEHLGGNEIAVVILRLFPYMPKNPAYIAICDLKDSATAI
jgi:hypothetical protein